MLSRDLLRWRSRSGELEPLWLGSGPSLITVAEQLLGLYRASHGARQSDIDEALPPIIHACRSQVVARGLHKIIADACTFTQGEDLRELRSAIFDASAKALRENPSAHCEGHRAQVLATIPDSDARLLEDPQLLYADLPQWARLEATPHWSAEEVIDRYNMHLAQGFLLGAHRLDLQLDGRQLSVGMRRRLLKALRWQRLLVHIQASAEDDVLRFEISGPGAVLDQRSRYGLQLAQLLPHIASLPHWQLQARVTPPRSPRDPQPGELLLRLDERAPLRGGSRFLAHVPKELSGLAAAWNPRLQPWQLSDEPPLLPIAGATGPEWVAPDYLLTHPQYGNFSLECLHRWHGTILPRRLQQITEGRAPRLLLAIDRALVRSGEGKALIEAFPQPQRLMLFNDLPTLSALKRLLAANSPDAPGTASK